MLHHALTDAVSDPVRSVCLCLPPSQSNYNCDFLPSPTDLWPASRNSGVIQIRPSPSLEPRDALCAHAAAAVKRRLRRSSSPPRRPWLSFPCSCFSHAPLAALLVPLPAIPQNRVSFGRRAHAEADQNKCPQVAQEATFAIRRRTPFQAHIIHRNLADHFAPIFVCARECRLGCMGARCAACGCHGPCLRFTTSLLRAAVFYRPC